ncbi:MAG: hypothetical protein CM15mP57_2420 [Alphaproteobacteria bacterium]|nr:MAG: hypothetical protein CM15mP57_2420 [Alphaproteobacteria bacterium]
MLHAFALKFTIYNKKFEFISELPDYFLTFIKKNNLKIKERFKKLFK